MQRLRQLTATFVAVSLLFFSIVSLDFHYVAHALSGSVCESHQKTELASSSILAIENDFPEGFCFFQLLAKSFVHQSKACLTGSLQKSSNLAAGIQRFVGNRPQDTVKNQYWIPYLIGPPLVLT